MSKQCLAASVDTGRKLVWTGSHVGLQVVCPEAVGVDQACRLSVS
jgi:hypothetical protein